MAGLLNSVNVQTAIAANSARESYDSISNLIDSNLKKLDADVFTAHDNPAGDDLTTVLNNEKNAARINAREAGDGISQIMPDTAQLSGNNLSAVSLARAIPEFGGTQNVFGALPNAAGGEEVASNSGGNNFSAPQAANNVQNVVSNASGLANNNQQASADNNAGGDTQQNMNGHYSDNGMNGANGTTGTSGMNGNNGTSSGTWDCGCGDGPHHCGRGNDGGHKHSGNNPWQGQHGGQDGWHHGHNGGGNDPQPEPTPPTSHLPHPHFPGISLLNVDVLGDLGGNLLHGHLGNSQNPLINVIAGGNVLGGQNNNSSSYGRLLDVKTNSNILNHSDKSPLQSGIDIGVLRGEKNAPLLEAGLHGDVLHNSGNLLDGNLTAGHDGHVAGLGVGIASPANSAQEKLAALLAQVAEKAMNDPGHVVEGINSLLESEVEGASNLTQPLAQVGLALATLGVAAVMDAHAAAAGVQNVATGALNLFSPHHSDMGNLAHIDLGAGSILGSNPLGIGIHANSPLPPVDANNPQVVDLNGHTNILSGDAGHNITANLGSGLISATPDNIAGVAISDSHQESSDVSVLGNNVLNNNGDSNLLNLPTSGHDGSGMDGGIVNVNTGNSQGGTDPLNLNLDGGHSSSGLVNVDLGNASGASGLVNVNVGSGHSDSGLLSANLNPTGGSANVSSGGTDLANVHMGSTSPDISLPVVSTIGGSTPDMTVSGGLGATANLGGTSVANLGGGQSSTGLSNLDPLSPFSDHSGAGGTDGSMHDVTGAGGTISNTLNNVTTMTHGSTSTDHHVVPLLHGHG